MKTMACGVVLLGLLASAAQAQQGVYSRIFAGARLHRANTVMKDTPYRDGDMSATVAWEVNEGAGFWQLALDYGWSGGLSDTADYILTPQLNLLFRDQMFVGGAGVLMSYVADDQRANKWTSLYYQILFGIEIPVGKLNIMAYTIYPLDRWEHLWQFKGRHIEYMAGVSYGF